MNRFNVEVVPDKNGPYQWKVTFTDGLEEYPPGVYSCETVDREILIELLEDYAIAINYNEVTEASLEDYLKVTGIW